MCLEWIHNSSYCATSCLPYCSPPLLSGQRRQNEWKAKICASSEFHLRYFKWKRTDFCYIFSTTILGAKPPHRPHCHRSPPPGSVSPMFDHRPDGSSSHPGANIVPWSCCRPLHAALAASIHWFLGGLAVTPPSFHSLEHYTLFLFLFIFLSSVSPYMKQISFYRKSQI